MDKFKEIRPIVLGMIKRDNKILVSKGNVNNLRKKEEILI